MKTLIDYFLSSPLYAFNSPTRPHSTGSHDPIAMSTGRACAPQSSRHAPSARYLKQLDARTHVRDSAWAPRVLWSLRRL